MSEQDDALEQAKKVLADVYAAFGFGPVVNAEKSGLLPYLSDGRLVFDPTKATLEYRLSAPIELKTEKTIDFVAFREPTALEVEYIRADLAGSISGGKIASATMRVLIKTGGLTVGLVERIKARDLDALSNIFTELGFFGR